MAQSFARVQFGSFQNPRRRAVVWKTVVGSKSNLENEAQDTNMASLAPGGYMGLVSERKRERVKKNKKKRGEGRGESADPEASG